jgi:hypothetical protein
MYLSIYLPESLADTYMYKEILSADRPSVPSRRYPLRPSTRHSIDVSVLVSLSDKIMQGEMNMSCYKFLSSAYLLYFGLIAMLSCMT